MYRIGLGSDIHKFRGGRPLVLGGIPIPHEQGLEGHSDADVVLHAIADACLGALALGDLGQYFPGDEKNKNRPSSEILREVCKMVWDKGYHVVNCDVMVIAEEPKLAPYKDAMAGHIALTMGIEKSHVSIKATTGEGLGAIGRGEGIFAQAIVLVVRKNVG